MSFICSDIENSLVLTWRKTNLSRTGFVLSLLMAMFGAVANLLIKNGIAGLLWLRILAAQKFYTCYPLFVRLNYSLISIRSFDFLHEKVSIRKLVGRVVIIVGIMTLARG
jgi:multidrug transporter EmrE-like cation transporter